MTTGLDSKRTSYDDVPYESFPFPQTHPERLATLATLFALNPPPLDHCRVLELGCAAGGNLIPMALTMPDATFVGVDLSAVQVAQGQKIIQELGLRNIRLLAMSITDIDASLGEFDYILSHGVYSWVPDFVQEKMLRICSEQLSANGIAYISYNTLPGWRMRGMIRDLMRFQAMQFPDPTSRVAQARAILDFLAKSVPADNNAYGLLLRSELDSLRHSPDYYILHEHLEDINEPLYFHEFIERVTKQGLQYLAEADFSTMLASNFAAEVKETVLRIAPDVIRQEQLMDYLRNRTFRQTLLVHQRHDIDRTITPERIKCLWVSSALHPVNQTLDLSDEKEEDFQTPNGGILRTSNPITKASVLILAQHWPGSVLFDDLLNKALTLLKHRNIDRHGPAHLTVDDTLASDLLQCHAAGFLDLSVCPSQYVEHAGSHPKASPLARWQAAQGLKQVTTLRHELVTIDENLGRLLTILDGTRNRDTLYQIVTRWSLNESSKRLKKQKELPGVVRERVDAALLQLAKAALLIT